MPANLTNQLEILLGPRSEGQFHSGKHGLAIVSFRTEAPTKEPASPEPITAAPVHIPPFLPHLSGPRGEAWITSKESSLLSFEGGRLAHNGDLLFGYATTDEARGDTLDGVSRLLFQKLLALTGDLGYSHLLRVWAYVPRINGVEEGLERYQRFCRGRATALEQRYGPDFAQNLCASSAVGCDSGPMVVQVMASREPGQHLENSRQLAAYHYPPQYGPRSPSFARATIVPELLGGTTLLISGTASIVGHETWHVGDVEAQTRETLRNLDVLLAAGPVPHQIVTLRVYLRHAADYPAVAAIVIDWLGDATRIVWLRADICRPDLLVEIEGVAIQAG